MDEEKQRLIDARLEAQPMTHFVWPRSFSEEVMMEHLTESIRSGQLTNHGPAVRPRELRLAPYACHRCALCRAHGLVAASSTMFGRCS